MSEPPDAVEQAFLRGDFLEARRLAAQLAGSSDEKERERGQAIARRFANDPAVAAILLGSLLFFAVTLLAYFH